MSTFRMYPRPRAVARAAAVRWRERHLRPDDSLLISYPKSGNTWLRFLLANLGDDEVDFDSIRLLAPPLQRLRHPAVIRQHGRLVKSHEQPRRQLLARTGPSVYLVRDPVHVYLSYRDHIQASHRDRLDDDALVEGFVKGRLDGYGRWDTHVQRALEAHATAPDRLTIVRFEDLRRDPAGVVGVVAPALGREAAPEAIHHAVERSSVDRMRSLESSSTWLRQNRLDDSKPFVAQGGVRSAEGLTHAIHERILDAFGPALSSLDSSC